MSLSAAPGGATPFHGWHDVRLIAFTDAGQAQACALAHKLGLPEGAAMRCGQPRGLGDWTAAGFAEHADALVFVGATGIAVRAVAPHLVSKACDPAVVVVDEGARFAIPLVSGHLGGANELAVHIAGLLGATPVVTTATDGRGVFAVDSWARAQGCAVENPERIKDVSGKLLAGATVVVRSAWPVDGPVPAGVRLLVGDEQPAVAADVHVNLGRAANAASLHVVPRIVVAGIGCRRGLSCAVIKRAVEQALYEAGIADVALRAVASIDIKRDEVGLEEFCAGRGLPFKVFSAEELCAVEGTFASSAFVRSVAGVDNVCERAAVRASGGTLLLPKSAHDGVTVALAVAPFAPSWSWSCGYAYQQVKE